MKSQEYRNISLILLYLLERTSAEEDIALFAQHYKLQKTLRQLSQENNVGDLPVHLPKVIISSSARSVV